MDEALRRGDGDYAHQQGPAPQQREHDRVGHVVADVFQHSGSITKRHRYGDVISPSPAG